MPRGEALRVGDADGRRLDPEDAGIELGDDRVDRRPVGEHREDDLGAVDRLRGRVGDRAPSPSAFSGVRFQALTSCPAAARFRAIGPPMIPVPSTAMRMGASRV